MAKKLQLYKYLNLVLILACFLAVCKFYIDSEIFAPRDTVFISPILNSSDYMFSYYDIKRMNDDKSSSLISFEKIAHSFVVYEYNSVYAKSIYINADYFQINHLEYLKGANFPEEYNDEKLVILGSSLAFKLFGSFECIGKSVRINGELYEVTGIVQQSENFDEDFLWLPYGSAEFSGYDISGIYIKDNVYNKLNTQEKAIDYISRAGKTENNYHITDLNQYRDNMLIRIPLIFMIVAAIIMLSTIKNIISLMDYYRDNFKKIAVNSACFAIFSAAIIICTRFISDRLWVIEGMFEILAFIENVLNIDMLPSKEYLPYQLRALKSINSYSVGALGGCIFFIVNFFLVCWVSKAKDSK